MTTTKKINGNGTEISVLRSSSTIEYLGVWVQLHNPKFKRIEFDGFRQQAGLNAFSLTPKEWAEKTNAIGIYSKAGRYGGTLINADLPLCQR